MSDDRATQTKDTTHTHTSSIQSLISFQQHFLDIFVCSVGQNMTIRMYVTAEHHQNMTIRMHITAEHHQDDDNSCGISSGFDVEEPLFILDEASLHPLQR